MEEQHKKIQIIVVVIPSINRSFVYKAKGGRHVRISHIIQRALNAIHFAVECYCVLIIDI